MSNYNEMIGETVITDAGEHEIVAHVYDDNCTDQSINLYVGRDAKGYYNLIASDNASMWVVGDENDASHNYDQWATIGDRYDAARDAIREVDAYLADWLDARRAEATIRGELDEPREITNEERQRLVDANYSLDSLDGAKVIAEENSAKLYSIGGGYGYAVEGETGEIIADLDFAEALVQWR